MRFFNKCLSWAQEELGALGSRDWELVLTAPATGIMLICNMQTDWWPEVYRTSSLLIRTIQDLIEESKLTLERFRGELPLPFQVAI